MRVKLWGTRGSIPTPEPEKSVYGGNTPCVEVEPSDGQRLVLDGGMGLHWLGHELLENSFGSGRGRAHLFLTHTHWGHIQGIPFCTPAMLIPGNHFIIRGHRTSEDSLGNVLRAQMEDTYCPVPNFFAGGIGSRMELREIDSGEFDVGDTRVTADLINHVPQTPCLAFRIEDSTASVAYLPDVEYLSDSDREQAVTLAADVDLLIHDAHFTAEEYEQRRGMGHASDRDAVEVARVAGARRLLLFHHHPDRDDDAIDAIVKAHAGESFPVEGAREQAEYALPAAT